MMSETHCVTRIQLIPATRLIWLELALRHRRPPWTRPAWRRSWQHASGTRIARTTSVVYNLASHSYSRVRLQLEPTEVKTQIQSQFQCMVCVNRQSLQRRSLLVGVSTSLPDAIASIRKRRRRPRLCIFSNACAHHAQARKHMFSGAAAWNSNEAEQALPQNAHQIGTTDGGPATAAACRNGCSGRRSPPQGRSVCCHRAASIVVVCRARALFCG